MGRPAVLSRLPLTPASFRLSGLRRTRQHRSDSNDDRRRYFLTRAFPLSSPQNAWIVFLLYVAFSKYGKIKLGRADEKPEFNNVSWFSMLFSCGIAVGVYTLGVKEPMSYLSLIHI